jgi:hypothetical protein
MDYPNRTDSHETVIHTAEYYGYIITLTDPMYRITEFILGDRYYLAPSDVLGPFSRQVTTSHIHPDGTIHPDDMKRILEPTRVRLNTFCKQRGVREALQTLADKMTEANFWAFHSYPYIALMYDASAILSVTKGKYTQARAKIKRFMEEHDRRNPPEEEEGE